MNPKAIDSIGLEEEVSGDSASENSLREIFAVASKYHCSARFLRLGGPRRFRADVIAILDNTGESPTTGYDLLIDKNIPDIEFLLSDPYSESFLSRMDAEGHDNWEIWRVKEDVLSFARGLFRASQQRARLNLSEIKIAFHSCNLIWNIGIAAGHRINIRSYFGSASGHDVRVAELHLLPGKSPRLAESFSSYFESVKNDSRTDFIHSEEQLGSVGNWPSLFKGNAIHCPSESEHPSKDSKPNLLPQLVEKSCCSENGNKAEIAWLSYKRPDVPKCLFFNPIKLHKIAHFEKPWKGQVLSMRRINGISAKELLWHIQGIGSRYPELIPKLEILSGSIVFQAFQALSEFRQTGKHLLSLKREFRPYPWAQQLENAVQEAGKFVIDRKSELSECTNEAKQLGLTLNAMLETFGRVPFRDAHLKNRLVAINGDFAACDYKQLREWLHYAEPEEIFTRLRLATYDIDFETCLWTVSEWDDPFHILWSNHLGFGDGKELANSFNLLKTWWIQPDADSVKRVMWITLLCRSLREYCRRLWYNHVMPETYVLRYSIEARDHFLELALGAAAHVDGFTAIKDFLEKCSTSKDSIWNGTKTEATVDYVNATFPSFANILEPSTFQSRDCDDFQLIPIQGESTGALKRITKGGTAVSLSDTYTKKIDENRSIALQATRSGESNKAKEMSKALDDCSYEELDELSMQIRKVVKNKPELSHLLIPLIDLLLRMKVALVQIAKLDSDFSNGNTTEDAYYTQRKKQVRDFEDARDILKCELVDHMIEKVEDVESKSRLARAKEAIRSNKDLLLFVAEIVAKILPGH